LVLIGGWALIWVGTVKENDIGDFFFEKTGISFFGDWAGTLVMTIVNYLIPWVLSIIGELEEWDFAS
jgi:hypothetical protein